MGTDGHCTVQLQTWGQNISPPATLLPPYSHCQNMKQTAHNNVSKEIENQVQHINTETQHAQWDWKVLTFLTHSANANALKVSNHSTRSPKRKLDELFKPCDDITSSQGPDGLIEDTKLKHIYIIEVTRTDHSPDYSCERTLRKCVRVIIGIQESINEQQWKQQLTEVGMNSHQQDKAIQQCITTSIRGTYTVTSSSEKQGNNGR